MRTFIPVKHMKPVKWVAGYPGDMLVANMATQSNLCSRCHGLLVNTWLLDMANTSLPVQRCVACGDITDPGIVANRTGKGVSERSRVRQRSAFARLQPRAQITEGE